MRDALIVLVGLLPLLSVFAFAIWARYRRRSLPDQVLVEVGGRKTWTTRPRRVRQPDELLLLKAIGAAIERSGAGAPKVLMFLGQPTMDLVVHAREADSVAAQLRVVLSEYPVVVSAVGQRGALRWVAKLWRHQ